MTHLDHGIDIARPPAAVLDYAATASRWPEWHPSSLRVVGPATSLVAGERFEEDIRAGGREGHLVWNVVAAEPGKRWHAHASGSDNGGLELELRYEVFPVDGGTRFVRSLEYELTSRWMRVANALVLRRRIERESAESLRILKQRLER